MKLVISIVLYHPDPRWLQQTLTSLAAALAAAHQEGALGTARVLLVDNQSPALAASPFPQVLLQLPTHPWLQAEVIAGHGNVGYGRGNNLAQAQVPEADFRLVLNPDIRLDPMALVAGLHYLQRHPDCAMVTPVATNEAGAPLYLVKAYPSLITLALRGFAPAWLQARFQSRLDAYDRRDQPFDAPLQDARIVSGCFMLMPGPAWARVGGFDPGFFLYFEDFDLSYRLSEAAAIARVPACRVVHGGGQAARKGLRHIGLFMRSAARFFAKHGWRW